MVVAMMTMLNLARGNARHATLMKERNKLFSLFDSKMQLSGSDKTASKNQLFFR